MFSALSSAITYVRAEEFSDIRTYNAPDVVRHIMGFGGTPGGGEAGPMLALLAGGFEQSVRMCLDALGFADAEIRTSHEVAVATAPIDSPDRRDRARPGRGAAVRLGGVRRRRPKVVRVAVNWLMGEEHLDPPWDVRSRAASASRSRSRATRTATSSSTAGTRPAIEAGLQRNPGIVATAVHCVNSIPYVCAAPAGLVTFVDLPLVAGRAHPDLARAT